MNTYYALLGNTTDISLEELEAVTGNVVTRVLPTLAKITTDRDVVELGELLGGTIKLLTPIKTSTPETLLADLTELLIASPQKNVALTAMTAPGVFTKSDIYHLKEEVMLSRSIRFLSLEVQGHSLIALRKQHVAEFVVLSDDGVLTIAQTAWIQDADDWTMRDRKKPYQDIKRGMLPPKVARILSNLACSGKTGLILADPFCGTGTVVAEAAMIGCKTVYGSDTDQSAITGADKNMAWLKSVYNMTNLDSRCEVGDATHLDERLKTVDAIAAEPYMGPLIQAEQFPDMEKVRNVAKGLAKLYIGSLKSWHKILTGKGRVVLTIPSFNIVNRTVTTLTVDDYARLGYNYISSVPYGKPGATVIRNITILQKD